MKHILKEAAVKLYEAKESEFPEPEQLRELERVVLLKSIDSKWMDHIDDMEILRQGIGLAAYGQRDPVVEYKMSAYEMFNNMTNAIQEDTVRMLYHVHVEQKIEREQVAKVTGTNKDDSGVKKPVQRKEEKIYPNDPCPCGSGKNINSAAGARLQKYDRLRTVKVLEWDGEAEQDTAKTKGVLFVVQTTINARGI